MDKINLNIVDETEWDEVGEVRDHHSFKYVIQAAQNIILYFEL